MNRTFIALALAALTGCAGQRDANKALVKAAFEDVWTKKDPAAVHKYYAPDFVNHAAVPSAQGANGLESIARKLQTAFPDAVMSIEAITAEDDIVVTRTVFDGTHKETLAFVKPIEATNKHLHITQMHTYRIKDGRIVETWMTMDRLDFNTQLGLGPK
jgi:steroid delta-isomerase-like uncharacterized protein